MGVPRSPSASPLRTLRIPSFSSHLWCSRLVSIRLTLVPSRTMIMYLVSPRQMFIERSLGFNLWKRNRIVSQGGRAG